MTYRAGIVGAGGVAGMGLLGTHDLGEEAVRASHAGGYRETDGIDLVAVADIDQEKLDAFGDAWSIEEQHRYLNHQTMCEEEELNAVSIATPTYLHHDHVIDAVEFGNPDVLWCEKPIASSVTEAQEMIIACTDANTELVINHTLRFTDKMQRLRVKVQRDNLIGDVQSVHARFRMELMRNSTHLLDTIVFILDSRARRAAGYITNENEAVEALAATVEVDDSGGGGFVVMNDGTFVSVNCTDPREISSMQYDFIGTDGKLYLNNDDGEWRFWRVTDGGHVEDDLEGIDRGWTWNKDYEEGFPNAARHVVDLLDGNTDTISTGQDAVRSLEMIVAFYVSDITGSQVSLPLDRPLRDVRITSW